jgi:hypothetical protein
MPSSWIGTKSARQIKQSMKDIGRLDLLSDYETAIKHRKQYDQKMHRHWKKLGLNRFGELVG